MLDEFTIHNQFKESIARFEQYDPHLRRVAQSSIIYTSALMQQSDLYVPGIYLISGGRQVGKSTFLKQFILNLFKNHQVTVDNVLFLTGELIDTHHNLKRIIDDFYCENHDQYLFIDEVNYIPDWDKTIKYLADAGSFDSMRVILTGSDSQIIKTAMKRFAGRRGKSSQVNFEFNPLSFKETVLLKEKKIANISDQKLEKYFYEFLIHGGYLPAINEFLNTGTVNFSILNTYIDWIIGDMLKHGKSEQYLHEILAGIIKTYSTPISWNGMGRFLSIDHHKTISDYCELLEQLNVTHVIYALIEHKLVGAPKKNKKIYFRDPFIYNAVNWHIHGHQEFKIDFINDPIATSKIVEGVVLSEYKRYYPSYYIKGIKGEVDLAIIKNKTFLPIEIKWTKQIRLEDLKQLSLYSSGTILTLKKENIKINNFENKFLPRDLFELSATIN